MEAFVILVALVVVIFLLARYFAGDHFAAMDEPTVHLTAEPSGGPKPETLVRSYRAKDQATAARQMQADATTLGREGYVVASQSWAPGSYGCGAFLIALVLAIVLIGLLIFIYMLLVKPDGTLTVTFVRRAEPVPTTPAPPSAIADLERLAALRDSGVLTQEEFEAKKAEILARV